MEERASPPALLLDSGTNRRLSLRCQTGTVPLSRTPPSHAVSLSRTRPPPILSTIPPKNAKKRDDDHSEKRPRRRQLISHRRQSCCRRQHPLPSRVVDSSPLLSTTHLAASPASSAPHRRDPHLLRP